MKKTNIILALLFALFGLGAASAGADIACDFCGKDIQGKYFEYSSSAKHITVCLECNRTHPKCGACKLPHRASELKSVAGEKICSACQAKAFFCTLCKKRVEGQYYKSAQSNQVYCARCYNNYPHCKACGMPNQAANLDSVSQVCRQCLPKLSRCTSCGKAITGSYYEFNNAEGMYCADCKLNRAKCHVCGAPVGTKYWKYPDGRTVCLKCNERAVIDVGKIQQIMKEVEGLVNKGLGLKPKRAYTLRVEALNNNSFLDAKQVKQGHASGSPLTGSELGLYRLMGDKAEIFLLYGLPIELVYETAAHEYAHAWQAENCPLSQADDIREGFAQWVAAQVLKMKGFNTALERLEARSDRPYGSGYQRIQKVETALGKEALLEYVKKSIH